MRRTYVGQVFGRLTIVSEMPTSGAKCGWRRFCTARCSCGSGEKVYGLKNIRRGTTRSCGCFRRENSSHIAALHKVRHGHCEGRMNTPTYRTYRGMRSRCENPKATGYRYYGGRGIRVCARWKGPKGFINFLKDMGIRRIGTTLDRKRVNGIYSKSNCAWKTPSQQANNRRKAA